MADADMKMEYQAESKIVQGKLAAKIKRDENPIPADVTAAHNALKQGEVLINCSKAERAAVEAYLSGA